VDLSRDVFTQYAGIAVHKIITMKAGQTRWPCGSPVGYSEDWDRNAGRKKTRSCETDGHLTRHEGQGNERYAQDHRYADYAS